MKTTGTLFVVGTPIGNLDDISRRALSTLESVNLVVCEDTRVTKKLLDRYDLKPKLMSVHQHSGRAKIDEVVASLKHGNSVAVVTDAGTPGVADPGGMLVAAAYDAGIKVVAVPGPSAVTAALSVSGLPTDRFTFLGWLPHKKGRQTMLQALVDSSYTVIFFESPHRIMKTLERLRDLLPTDRLVVVCRELTKQFEEVVRGSAGYVFDVFTDNPGKVRGEFVVVIGPSTA
ncbi:MAG: 16S rRNA (cytidine(1402)-2'-O)-methyltransferase [Candidatus Kerfeldbacteria bacterium]|nr:16S rRNA (cytidine(1402)-2'-O)-methyltransferase [Candidatus Kerfeldbacteria bacterium]